VYEVLPLLICRLLSGVICLVVLEDATVPVPGLLMPERGPVIPVFSFAAMRPDAGVPCLGP